MTRSIVLSVLFFPWASLATVTSIVITPMEQVAPIYSCMGYFMTFLDENGVATQTTVPLNLSIYEYTGTVELFANAGIGGGGCTSGRITSGAFTVPAGFSFYRIQARSQVPLNTKIYLSGIGTPFSFNASLVASVYFHEPTEIVFETKTNSIRVGLCTAVKFRYVDQNGDYVALDRLHTANLSFSEGVQGNLYSDSACTNSISQIETPPGQSGNTVYVRLFDGNSGQIKIEDSQSSLQGVAYIDAVPITYEDVGIVINLQSPESIAIAQTFAESRQIPESNLFYVVAPTSEIISNAEFVAIRNQLEPQLPLYTDPNRKINFLVTTKGLPLAIERDAHYNGASTSASFESEIALLKGAFTSKIGLSSWYTSPYYGRDQTFSRSTYGFFLVTRLDAYTLKDALQLMDRSRPLLSASIASSQFILDQDPLWSSSSLNAELSVAASMLLSKNFQVELDSTTEYVTSRSNVIGYTSWGSNDHTFPWSIGPSLPGFSWLPGSIAETYVSTSGRSFAPGTSYGQSLIADLVDEGVSGAKGYVFEPMVTAMAHMQIVFDRYVRGYNFAESFSMGSSSLSWMDVLIGDPKMSILPESKTKTKGEEMIEISAYKSHLQSGHRQHSGVHTTRLSNFRPQ